MLNKSKIKKADCNKSANINTFLSIIIWFFIICLVITFGLNCFVYTSAKTNICDANELKTNSADCIMVLGCGVRGEEPSPMLKDRLDTAVELYKKGVAKKLLMSGDHGNEFYNEVGVMKVYAIQNGVPAEDIFMDHAGFSTYESLYRAKELFGLKNFVAVTQKYHTYRTAFLGKSLEINIDVVSAKKYNYGGTFIREIREILARDKDVITSILKPVPKLPLGGKIDISQNGNITNDEAFFRLAKNKKIEIN